MATAGNDGEERKKKLAWLQYACDQRDAEAEKLQQELDEAQKNLEGILDENERLDKALQEANFDRECYEKILINQELLEDAIAVYETKSDEAKDRAEKAEAKVEELKKQYENLVTINKLYERQLKILNREQQKDAFGDLLSGQSSKSPASGGVNSPGPVVNSPVPTSTLATPGISSRSIAVLNGLLAGRQAITANGATSASTSAPSTTSSKNGLCDQSSIEPTFNGEGFVKNLTAHIALVQAAAGQFCGAYGLKIPNFDAAVAAISSSTQRREDAQVQTIISQSPSSSKLSNSLDFCADCADMKLELDSLKDEAKRVDTKDKKIDSLKARLARRVDDLDRQDDEIKTYREDIKEQNRRIRDLIAKLAEIRDTNLRLRREKKDLQKRLEKAQKKLGEKDQRSDERRASVNSTEAGSSSNRGGTESAPSSSASESGSSAATTPTPSVKRKAPMSDGEIEDEKPICVKFKVGKDRKIEVARPGMFSP